MICAGTQSASMLEDPGVLLLRLTMRLLFACGDDRREADQLGQLLTPPEVTRGPEQRSNVMAQPGK